MQDQDLFKHFEDNQFFAAGQIIFREGETGEVFYLVAEGEVDISTGHHQLETVGPGGILGELALIDKKPRSATVTARTDCLLTVIDREHFLALIQRTPLFALQVMRVMADRLRRTTDQLRSK
ncbi:MAG: cyclic nucleotide-binding protein [Candidatus Contendobacter odensis]|uniref:Cyclic nucleotide-binding protein n=1 Tax=Candidatus Contendibacter odensensis TaxID=1400860 RepID=A0A2G6PGL1_9GAMM|nr:MAG: cyclic nucleotide-binding protein [Candidatus Contendobacter odensis]